MSEISCRACQDLSNAAPEFVTNGVTNAVCTSLGNNTGLDKNNGHNDATDLHIANDCLIGRMKTEIGGFDVCDWKEFMKLYIGNDYEMNKAMICAIGGLWKTIQTIIDALGGGNGRIPVIRRYRVTVPASAFGQSWRVTQGAQEATYFTPGSEPGYFNVENITEWFAGSGNNEEVGEFWVKVPVSEMDDITGVWTQTWVVPGGNPFDGVGKAFIQTVNVQQWTRNGDYLDVNFDTYELCPPRTLPDGHNGGPYPVTVDFLIVGTRQLL